VGYVMGWADAEIERQRRVISELEAKNVELAQKVIELRGELEGTRGEGPGPRASDRP
jgi:hypothetical protein